MMSTSEPPSGNIFADVPVDPGQEEFSNLLKLPGTRVERIVSLGQTTPEGQWYDQDWTEWVIVLQGHARILLEGETEPRDLRPGDWLELAAGVRHRVVFTDPTQPTIWIAVHAERR